MADQVKADTRPGDTSTLALLLGTNMSDRMRKLVSAQYMAAILWRVSLARYKQVRARITYTLTVDGDDPLYPELHAWLLSLLPPHRQRSLIVQSSDRSFGNEILASPGYDDSDRKPKPPPLRFLFDGEREQEVVIGGHKIKVSVSVERAGKEYRREYRITFVCFGLAARDAVTKMLSDVARARTDVERLPRLYLASRWGDWERRDDLAARDPDSVILRAGVMAHLLDDLAQFRTHEADYIRLGMPFHRGYLFHGPPGSGKSSVARAMASHFGMDLYYLPLGDMSSDANLTQMVARIPAGSVLLLEDIDTFGVARQRGDQEQATTGTALDPGATLSGLLNALDGMVTPHGLVTMMTTNNRAVLDAGLIRDFRVNVDQEIDYLDTDQLARLLDKFTGSHLIDAEFAEPARIPADLQITSAQVLGIVMANLDNPSRSLSAIHELFRLPRTRVVRASEVRKA